MDGGSQSHSPGGAGTHVAHGAACRGRLGLGSTGACVQEALDGRAVGAAAAPPHAVSEAVATKGAIDGGADDPNCRGSGRPFFGGCAEARASELPRVRPDATRGLSHGIDTRPLSFCRSVSARPTFEAF